MQEAVAGNEPGSATENAATNDTADSISVIPPAISAASSPRNARLLLAALRRATAGKSRPQSLDKLKREMGLGTASVR